MILVGTSEGTVKEHLPCQVGRRGGSVGGEEAQKGRLHSQVTKRPQEALSSPTWERSRLEHREDGARSPLGRGKVRAEPRGKGRKVQKGGWAVPRE